MPLTMMLSRHDLPGDLAPRADLLAIEQQHPRHEGQQRGDPAQQTTRAGIAQLSEHLIREQWKDGGEDIPRKPLRGQRTRRVPMVHVGQVIEHGEIDDEDAHLGATQRQHGRDPVHARERGPSEPKEPDRQQRGLETGKIQPALGGRGEFRPVLFRNAFLEHTHNRRQDRADRDGREHGAGLFGVEAVSSAEHERDDGECHVQQRPGEGGPQREKEHDGFGEQELEGDGE